MNTERLIAAQELMNNLPAERLFMAQWQQLGLHGYKTELEEADKCGTVCCMAGHVALSHKFRDAGGTVGIGSGTPTFKGKTGGKALSMYFDIPYETASCLCCTDCQSESLYSFTEKTKNGTFDTDNITPTDVAFAIQRILNGWKL